MGNRARTLAVVSFVALAALALQTPGIAEAQERALNFPHLRSLDPRTRAAIDEGIRRSALFGELVAEIENSDLIVYVEPDCTMRDTVQGKLIFVTAAPPVRYLRVRIACHLTRIEQIAILGHELQHAVEVANAPWVVDEGSLASEYRRIGFASRTASPGMAFESQAAIDAGQRVLRELMSRTD
jgi:hypothetical protein